MTGRRFSAETFDTPKTPNYSKAIINVLEM